MTAFLTSPRRYSRRTLVTVVRTCTSLQFTFKSTHCSSSVRHGRSHFSHPGSNLASELALICHILAASFTLTAPMPVHRGHQTNCTAVMYRGGMGRSGDRQVPLSLSYANNSALSKGWTAKEDYIPFKAQWNSRIVNTRGLFLPQWGKQERGLKTPK